MIRWHRKHKKKFAIRDENALEAWGRLIPALGSFGRTLRDIEFDIGDEGIITVSDDGLPIETFATSCYIFPQLTTQILDWVGDGGELVYPDDSLFG